MKSDMGGAAAVIAAMTAIARLEPAGERHRLGSAWPRTCRPGTAQRPSDVLTMYGGKTVEVLNTDAEGRLVLADALVPAPARRSPTWSSTSRRSPARSWWRSAAGPSAIMANDDDVRDGVVGRRRGAGEAMWPMPLPDGAAQVDGLRRADIANMGDRYGGMLVAGLFLKEFVGEGLRWAHLDIAGPAFNDGAPHGYTPKGGTGAGVRTLVQIAEDLADGTI